MSFRRKKTKNGYLTRGNGKVEDIGKWGVEENKIFECEEEKHRMAFKPNCKQKRERAAHLRDFFKLFVTHLICHGGQVR